MSRQERAEIFANRAMQKVMHNPDTWKEGIPLPYFTEEMAVRMLVEFADGEDRNGKGGGSHGE